MTRPATALMAILIFVAFQAVAAAPDRSRIEAALETLRHAINAHDYSMLEPHLDDAYTWQGQDRGTSVMIAKQVLEAYPREISAITILDIRPAGTGWALTVRLEGAGEDDPREVTLSAEYRIVQADIATIRLGGHSQPSDETSGASIGDSIPPVTVVPFELVDRLILVRARINGVVGDYIVDSGAQALVLNSARFPPGAINTKELDHAPPAGVGGAMQDVRGSTDLELSWGDIRLTGLRGLVADLSHMEGNLGGIELAGLIGFNVLRRFQVQFDYSAQQLTLLALDGAGRPVRSPEMGEPELIVSLEFTGHIPVLAVRISGLDLKMGLDSGAAGAMLFTKWQDPLREHYEFIKRTEMRGADHNMQMGDVVRLPEMRLGDLVYRDMTFRFNDIAAHGDRPVPIDGLLGYEFLKSRPTAINFRTAQLLVWSETR